MTTRNIGLFGGTFNPVHHGHLRAALEIRERFELSRICLVPSAIPPHKSTAELVSADLRTAMLELSVKGCEELSVSRVEVNREGPSYTVDTIRQLGKQYPENLYHLIIGMDAFLEIHSWYDFRSLFSLAPMIVMARPGAGETDKALEMEVGEFLRTRIDKGYAPGPDGPGFVHETLQPVFFFETTPLSISSTEIRQRVREGRTIRFLVPREVEDYIISKGLYL